MFDLDLKSRKPIYEQLIENIKMMIIQKVLNIDEQLPSVRSLAQELTINPNTIQRAYRELEREGFIYSLPGRGSFVSDVNAAVNKERSQMLTEDLERIIKELLYLDVPADNLKSIIDQAATEIEGIPDREEERKK